MSLPAIRALGERYTNAHVTVLARPALLDLYARERSIHGRIAYTARKRPGDWRRAAAEWRAGEFDWAILFQNAFEAALVARMAGIPRRIGYRRDGRGWLLTDAIAVPRPGDIPRHERFYYLELLRRAGLIDELPALERIRLDRIEEARQAGLRRFAEIGIAGAAIGVSPGAAYGNAKRWLPERFAETAASVAREREAAVALFGSADERGLCEQVTEGVRSAGASAHNFAGQTRLGEFIELAAACRLFLTNDSGAMHIASALDVPTVAVFGATDDTTTGPTGPWARVVRQQVECSPCLLRECPIDHRCMTRVDPERVVAAALTIWDRRGY